MCAKKSKSKYFELGITADTPATEIWLGDDGGSLVVKGVGSFRESLLAGNYVVEFGLGTPCYPVVLRSDCSYTQGELRLSGPCDGPVFQLTEEDAGREVRTR